jgi:ABC-type polysaccharide/polyol phosphate transport system ATPase subunit
MYKLFDVQSHRLLEALHPLRRVYHRPFWALHDISLVIKRGQTVGILGMNGSGKSTLLQIISSVLQPTSGEMQINGRVAALLELGAGFNPNLTARDNVVVNGIIMGLSQEQMRNRMRDIEAFADIGEFFDQPMRVYSSGMFARVAFATAIHVDPDILIIDEALSVGDARFQEKCFRRFRQFQELGKTIIYVTHDRFSVTRLCDRAVLLHRGELTAVGEPRQITDMYDELLVTQRQGGASGKKEDDVSGGLVETASKSKAEVLREFMDSDGLTDRCALRANYNRYEHRFGVGGAEIVDYLLMTGDSIDRLSARTGDIVRMFVHVRFHRAMDQPILGLHICNSEGIQMSAVNTEMLHQRGPPATAGESVRAVFEFPLRVGNGDWFIDLTVAETNTEICDSRASICHLQVESPIPHVGLMPMEVNVTVLEAGHELQMAQRIVGVAE